MTDLQKEFEATGYTSWINSDLYPDGEIYTKEYTQWLERQVLKLRQTGFSGSVQDFKEIIQFLQWVYRKIDKGDTPQETVRILLMNRAKIDSIKFDSSDPKAEIGAAKLR